MTVEVTEVEAMEVKVAEMEVQKGRSRAKVGTGQEQGWSRRRKWQEQRHAGRK